MDVGHDVMTKAPLQRIRAGEINIVDVGPHLFNLRAGNARRHAVVGRHPQLVLRFGKGQPHAPPGAEFPLWTPKLGHFPSGVARDQWIVVNGRIVHPCLVFRAP